MKTKVDENTTPETIIAEAMVGAGAPLMHSRVEEAVAGALRKAGMLVERSEQVCAWCPSSARGSAWHNDGKLHPSCGQIDHGQGWVPEYPVDVLMSVRVERDAATAAIERARVEVESINQAAQKSLCGSEPDHAGIYEGAARALAALDGAPEPEWEYGYRGRYAVMHPTKAGQSIETPEITQRTPDNWLPEMGEIYRRRPSLPAGPWLPLKGESE